MNRFEPVGRDFRALIHYRPRQLVHRLALQARRRLTSLGPERLRTHVRRVAERAIPAGELRCPDALRTYALDIDVSRPSGCEDLLEGRFTFIGQTRDLGERPDWYWERSPAPSHLWRVNLHYHRFLVDAVAGALRSPETGDALLNRAASLLNHWSKCCQAGDPRSWEAAWSSYAVSARLLNSWVARLLLDGFPGDSAERLRRRLDVHAASGAAFLMRWLELDLEGNHLLRNATALLAAGRWFEGEIARQWRQTGRRLLLRELERQVLADGFHEERSPMYHATLIEDLLLAALEPKTERVEDEALRDWIARLVSALAPVLHPDGEIALFNDSAFGIAAPIATLTSLATDLGVPAAPVTTDLASAGYYRCGGGPDGLVFDAGRLGPDHLPAHAHCDALSFEYSAGAERLVVDTGVDRYEPGPERDFQRGTAAHATLQIGDLHQGEPFGSFRMGRRPRVEGRRVDERTLEGRHDGFLPLGLHRRRLCWNGPTGFSWIDVVEGAREVAVTIRIGLAPRVTVDVQPTGTVVQGQAGTRFLLNAPRHGAVSVEQGVYCERFGRAVPRSVVCWRGVAGGGTELAFSLARHA
jgi:uncharacterized heparinase superfamily protein